VAIELNKLDKMLSEAEVRIINHNITCIKKYIDVKKNISDCKALEWIETT
jgi:phosphopantothenate synthetase